MNRLPEKFWRVNVHDGLGKLRGYDRKSKTYASEEHARNAVDGFRSRDIQCDLYESGPVVWECIDAGRPSVDGEQPLWQDDPTENH
jgi:hypothetical protein